MKTLVSDEAMQKIIAWTFAGDTGVSSESMACIALGIEKQDRFGYHAPSDPSDFGRCYRLVMKVPEIIDAFPAISKKVPRFKGILENWDELCGMYEADLNKGKSVKMYNRMKELLGDTWRLPEND